MNARLDYSGIDARQGQETVPSPKRADPLWVSLSPYSMRTKFFPGMVKGPGGEADRSPPHVGPRLTMSAAIDLLPLQHVPSWRAETAVPSP